MAEQEVQAPVVCKAHRMPIVALFVVARSSGLPTPARYSWCLPRSHSWKGPRSFRLVGLGLLDAQREQKEQPLLFSVCIALVLSGACQAAALELEQSRRLLSSTAEQQELCSKQAIGFAA